MDGGEPENPEENPLRSDENLQQTQYTPNAGSLVGIEPSHNVYCAILTCSLYYFKIKTTYLMLDLLSYFRLDETALRERGAQLVSLKLTLVYRCDM